MQHQIDFQGAPCKLYNIIDDQGWRTYGTRKKKKCNLLKF